MSKQTKQKGNAKTLLDGEEIDIDDDEMEKQEKTKENLKEDDTEDESDDDTDDDESNDGSDDESDDDDSDDDNETNESDNTSNESDETETPGKKKKKKKEKRLLDPKTDFTNVERIIYKSLITFFKTKCSEKQIDQMFGMIGGESKISLRMLEWFVMTHSKKHIDIEESSFDIHSSYKAQLSSYSKNYFDPFGRGDNFVFKYKSREPITTTLCQLNFFKWVFENNILKMIEDNHKNLCKIMKEDNKKSKNNKQKKSQKRKSNGKKNNKPTKQPVKNEPLDLTIDLS